LRDGLNRHNLIYPVLWMTPGDRPSLSAGALPPLILLIYLIGWGTDGQHSASLANVTAITWAKASSSSTG